MYLGMLSLAEVGREGERVIRVTSSELDGTHERLLAAGNAPIDGVYHFLGDDLSISICLSVTERLKPRLDNPPPEVNPAGALLAPLAASLGRATVNRESTECPECGRRVQVGVPRGGDGSAVVFFNHAPAVGSDERCQGSRMIAGRRVE